LLTLTIGLGVVLTPAARADAPRVLPKGKLPDDRRLQPPKDLNGYFPFKVPATKAAWEERASFLRRRILVATGLWPMPPKTPLRAKIYGKTRRDGFTVEKVHFESYPGHFVSGLLFRPEETSGKCPAVLCPHGHGGREQDHGKNIGSLIKSGQEQFEVSGRFPKIARCAQLARMGCVTFIFDMLGYVDSVQIPMGVAHRMRVPRPGNDTPKSWRLFSAQAELRLQSIFGIQTYNSIRALDFLQSLPDVDGSRIGVTGGSGGGTQTIICCAIDPRPIVAFPQGMVSTSMQGGCTCENCSLLRIGSGNVELAGLFAPKPQGMTAANDWTKAMMTEGYPSLKKLYALHGVEDRVHCKAQLQFPHNYNYPTRQIMYGLFNRHLKLGLAEPIVERDWPALTKAETTVWDADHPQPEKGESHERKLTKRIDEIARRQLDALTPRDAASLAKYREVIGGAFSAIIGRGILPTSDVSRERVSKSDRGSYLEFTDLLRVVSHGEEIPLVSLYPKKGFEGDVALWFDGNGKNGLFDDRGKPVAAVASLLEDGVAVLTADLFLQGEFTKDGTEPTSTRIVRNPRQFACFTHCYNDSLFARRVHDILTVASFVAGDERVGQVSLVGVRGAGPVAAVAAALAGDVVDHRVIDTGGFVFSDIQSFRDPGFLPGAVKYGGLSGALSLCAPHALTILGEEGRLSDLVEATYAAAGARSKARSIDKNDVLEAAAKAVGRSN
jgi:cephalosporin-C deacetylase-like acetyl esterase